MSTIYLVTGGARSGKSSYAERLCEELSTDNKIYVATAPPPVDDSEFAHRIDKHKEDRKSKQWIATIEEPMYLSRHVETFKTKVVLVDCMTLWLTNFMMDQGLFLGDIPDDDTDAIKNASQAAQQKIEEEFDKLTEPWNCTYVFVTNELGSGTHASTQSSRRFVDCQGWFNQYVAKRAQKVVHLVCGCPSVIKDNSAIASSTTSTTLSAPTTERIQAAQMLDHFLSKRSLQMDKKGYFIVKIDREKCVIRVSFHSCIVNDKGEFFDLEGHRLTCHGGSPEPLKVWECRTAKEATYQVLEKWDAARELLCVGHAGYLGREVQKAEAALYQGHMYQQD